MIATIKILPSSEAQGEFVIINAVDFDPAIHTRLPGDDAPIPGKYDHLTRDQLIDLALAGVKAEVAKLSDEELRQGLESHDRRYAARGDPEEDEPQLALALESTVGDDTLLAGAGEAAAAPRKRRSAPESAEPVPEASAQTVEPAAAEQPVEPATAAQPEA